MASEATKTKVAFALVSAGEPTSIQRIAWKTGLSYNTVKRALIDLKATGEGIYPVLYSLPSLEEAVEQRRELIEEPAKGWVRWYNEDLREALNAQITESSDPAAWAKSLVSLADKISVMASTLSDSSEDTDWYAKLGGTRKQALK